MPGCPGDLIGIGVLRAQGQNGRQGCPKQSHIYVVEWCDRARVDELVPFPFYGPVQEHLGTVLT